MKPHILYFTTGHNKLFERLDFEDRRHTVYTGYTENGLKEWLICGMECSAACFNFVPSGVELHYVLTRLRRSTVAKGWSTCYPIVAWLAHDTGDLWLKINDFTINITATGPYENVHVVLEDWLDTHNQLST
ncbi:hypothetical protein phiK7A1_013c [Pseudomonas phage phiK7A1]|uniref:Uncharacterized protein n=1 Tax=Pseudomonas phage phiK7A1 TaxID=2759194 RepID=A0A7H0XFL3_9CAUD|nr:hypothetical protein phiK7A1_013c [Pseudomonas phage phiK7A1]